MLPCKLASMSLHYYPSFNYPVSVIKPEDSFSGNQITAYDVMYWLCVYTCDLIAMYISLSQNKCLYLKQHNETQVSISVWRLFTIKIITVVSIPDLMHTTMEPPCSIHMEEGWTAWGRVSRMTSSWENWLLPCSNGRGGEADQMLLQHVRM